LEALQTLERRSSRNWDAQRQSHATEARQAVDRLLTRKAADPESFDDATKI
jgi:hypothetical protein